MAQDLVINGKTFEDVKQLAAKNANGETVIYSESEGGGSGLLQIKSVQPGKEQQIVKPDTGYYGLESVTVSGDKNLLAENIKSGVNIFGVRGNYESGGASGGADVSGVTAETKDVRQGKVFVDSTGAVKEGTQPTRGSADVTLANSKVTVPAGIYDEQVQMEVPASGEQATPVIEVSNSGLITATAGDKSATKQLSTQSGKTITPGATEQIAVAAGKYVTGDVIVAAVQSTGGGGAGGGVGGANATMVTLKADFPKPTVSATSIVTPWYVQSVDGASYGFSRNSDGYYQSGNKGKSDSYAMCQIKFQFDTEQTVELECINYAQKSYDYGLISEVDTMLSLDNSADSTGVLHSFKSQNSSDVVSVPVTVPAGNHFICVKFIKNGSTNSNNDTLQFTVKV